MGLEEAIIEAVKLGNEDRQKLVNVINALGETKPQEKERLKPVPQVDKEPAAPATKRHRRKGKRRAIEDDELRKFLELKSQGKTHQEISDITGRPVNVMYGPMWKNKLRELIKKHPDLEKYSSHV